MPDLTFRKQEHWLTAADDEAMRWLSKVPAGAYILMSPKHKDPRSLRQHRKFWGLINLLYDNQRAVPGSKDHIASKDWLKERLLIAIGEFDVMDVPGFGQVPRARSISFAAMNQADFNALYDKAKAFVEEHLSHVVGSDAERAVIEYLEAS